MPLVPLAAAHSWGELAAADAVLVVALLLSMQLLQVPAPYSASSSPAPPLLEELFVLLMQLCMDPVGASEGGLAGLQRTFRVC